MTYAPQTHAIARERETQTASFRLPNIKCRLYGIRTKKFLYFTFRLWKHLLSHSNSLAI